MIYYFDDTTRKLLTRIVFGWLFLVILYQWSANMMISQMDSPILMRVELDLTYWLVFLSGIGEALTQNYSVGLIFDMSLTLLCVITVVFPRKTIFPILTGLLFLIYTVVLNTYQCWHYHNIITLGLLIIPFCFRSLKLFSIFFAALRYAVAYVYASAAVWKLFRGSVFNEGQMQWLIEHNYVDRLAVSGYKMNFLEDWLSSFLYYPNLMAGAIILGVAMEASFIVAFFTKRFDRILIIIGVTFHLITTILVDVSFFAIVDAVHRLLAF